MSLHIHWYELVAISIVLASTIASIWVIRKHTQGCKTDTIILSEYESLPSIRGSHSGVEIGTETNSSSGFLEMSCLWRSAWHGIRPEWIFLFRLTAAIALSGTLVWDWRKYDASIFIYYTEWTFLLVILYFLIGASISAHGCWVISKKKMTENSEEENRFLKIDVGENVNFHSNLVSRVNNSEERAGTWGYCMQIIYQTCGGAVMLTDVVFWCLLAPFMQSAHFSVNLVMGCMHSLNLIFLLIDTALNSMPFPMFRMAYFVIWSCTYVIFQWVLHACGFSWWPYPFLKLSSPWAPLWYTIMALIHIPCYGIYWLIVKAKNTYFPRFFPNCYVRSY